MIASQAFISEFERFAPHSCRFMIATPSPPTPITSTKSDSNSNNTNNSNSTDQSDPSTTRASCTWTHNSECRTPRSCADCLNVQLPNDVCTVNPNGACVSQSTYNAYLADRFYYVPSQRYFSSSVYRYCHANDAVCVTCREQWKQLDPRYLSDPDARFPFYCTGHNGCVCIANCEAPNWHDVVVESQCAGGQQPLSLNDETALSMPLRVVVSIVAGLAMVLLLLFTTWGVRWLLRRRSSGQRGK